MRSGEDLWASRLSCSQGLRGGRTIPEGDWERLLTAPHS